MSVDIDTIRVYRKKEINLFTDTTLTPAATKWSLSKHLMYDVRSWLIRHKHLRTSTYLYIIYIPRALFYNIVL